MRKISTICRFPGRIYPVNLAALGFRVLALPFALSTSPSLQAQIALPPPPVAEPPPSLPDSKDPIQKRRLEREEKKSEAKKKIEAESIARKSQDAADKAKAEAQEKRPFYGFFDLSLLKPAAAVSGSRSNYTCDMTTHISTYLRMFFDKDPSVVQGWFGVRVAPFGGFGTQNKVTARFAMTFLGPAIAVGKVGMPDDPLNDNPKRFAWLWSGGVAAISKLSRDDETFKGAPSDFQGSGWAYESPALWSEVRWTRITRGALGFGVITGVQTASGKTFYYAGLSASGFY